MHERIEYTPGSGQRVLFPDTELQLCELPCETKNVSVRLSLATSHIGKGCDRDTYSVESQRKLCGASAESVDLLPSPGVGSEWIRDLPTDEGRESDQIYEFDGSTNAVVVPSSILNHNLTNKFSISFWMKHEPPAESLHGNNKHLKEHIICNSDDHKKNRHHFALFVRNCRLVLLLREEGGKEDKPHTTFKPAEWRWKLHQVCDHEWHHYSVSVDIPDVTLYVDGQKFKETNTNPDIVDDWPLHEVRDVNTTLVVGACWEGRETKMNYHFKGFLAGLSVLRGRTENPEVLSCLHRCKEGLHLPAADSLDPGTDVSVNSEATVVMIEGKDTIDVEDVLSQISYQNTREFPTPGRRSLRITTSVKCIDGKSVKVPNSYSYIIVLPPDQPSISLNGTANIARDYESFVQGIELFSTVTVSVNHEPEQDPDDQSNDNDLTDNNNSGDEGTRVNSVKTTSTEHNLDACTIQVYPPLNPDYEYFRLPVNYMQRLGVHYKQTKDGVIIRGADSVASYQSILRQILYFNRKPAYFLNRAFKLSCSELNGRFTSNDYIQTLTVIHPQGPQSNLLLLHTLTPSVNSALHSPPHHSSSSPSLSSSAGLSSHDSPTVNTLQSESQHAKESVSAARAQIHEHRVDVKDPHVKSVSSGLLDSGLMGASDPFPRSVNTHVSPIVVGHAVTVIIVVCVGFLVFMVVLGVIRIRAAHHRTAESKEDEQEMVWDDTALTITVNPLDQIEQEPENIHDDDEDSDSSGSTYHEEGDSTDDDEGDESPKNKGMTWDDSALNF